MEENSLNKKYGKQTETQVLIRFEMGQIVRHLVVGNLALIQISSV